MESAQTLKLLAVAAASATIAYLIYTRTGLTTGIIVLIMSGWILFQFRGLSKAWSSLGNFQNPVLFGINAFFASFIYLSWKTYPFNARIYISLGTFLLAGALSLLITKYWNIGP